MFESSVMDMSFLGSMHNWAGLRYIPRKLAANGVMLILSWQTSVIALRMKNNNIFGPIPIELGTVPLLQTLDLSNNLFSSPIPTSFAQLNGLHYLLNNNSLFEPFPLSLAKIPQLALILVHVVDFKRSSFQAHSSRLVQS
ncbi:putative LRR receptor-like serine/threonine-protein kinase [Cucumis melo var. makuwa]|uniref:LRR receptor-like serine/threonine-protein kinase n=1 Tax=Cucumis melo var. makuwa TaxID=1194695 RepID=A0A5A7TYK0_CUCMM|nr:putative LRR receptor-like serine/threonine-protein kinase [Cucumis melo var. makuwa]TYK09365.1 putative LRR receptor-like serine/threonine-protein kinase [Cucumis melo var. makuwa]